MLVTPLQMAMVAATVANGGVLMQPHLIDDGASRRTARSSTRVTPAARCGE